MMAYGAEPRPDETMALRCWGRIPFAVIETTAERLASTANELAEVTRIMRGCVDFECFSERMATLREIADDLHKHIAIYGAELGIGDPQPETTTEGAPVTEVDVDTSGGSPEDSKCPKCNAEMRPVLYCQACNHWPEYHTKRKDSEE